MMATMMAAAVRTLATPIALLLSLEGVSVASRPGRVPWCQGSRSSQLSTRELRYYPHKDRKARKRRAEGHCLAGKLHGRLTRWYPSGIKKAEAHYRHGRLHGRSRSYCPKGKLLGESHYRDGQRDLFACDTKQASVGCTVMSKRDLLTVLRWLEPAAKPVLVQLPSP
jgi:hypothetical protein